MSRRLIVAALALFALPVTASAQVEAHMNRLHGKRSWSFHTTAGVRSLSGKFAGINNDVFMVQDADGFRHAIPIDALVEEDRGLFFVMRNAPLAGMPGNFDRLMQTNEKFATSVNSRRGRETEAIYERRKLNADKPPARGWLAVTAPFNPFLGTGGRPMIEQGFVRQPPITYLPRRDFLLFR